MASPLVQLALGAGLGQVAVAGSSKGKAKASKEEDDPKKRRASKACDNCRRLKAKCVPSKDASGRDMPAGSACSNCLASGQECKFEAVVRKRGPPKGYLEAVENRLHRLEALLGSLLASDDPHAQALLAKLVEDEDSRDLLSADFRSAASAGINGPVRRSWQPSAPAASAAKPRYKPQLGFEIGQSSNAIPPEWQVGDTAMRDLPASPESDGEGSHLPRPVSSSAPYQRRRTDGSHGSDAAGSSLFAFQSLPPIGNEQAVPHTGFTIDVGADPQPSEDGPTTELADVVGQLSLNENSEVRYHGRSSGLYFLTQSRQYQRPYWRFTRGPQNPSSDGPLDVSGRSDAEVLQIAGVAGSMPDQATQEKLMAAYWRWVHPFLPILYRSAFLGQYRRTLSNPQPTALRATPDCVPAFLLMAIFAVAARYVEEPDQTLEAGRHWSAGDVYYARARALLATDDFGSSRITTIQGLLLMAYREAGTGALARSWALLGMAVRMAHDLGLHRDVDRWHMPGGQLTHEDKQARKRCWAACVLMDRYLSAYIGRPMAIHVNDHDAAYPSETEPDEFDQWSPDDSSPQIRSYHISLFNRICSLSDHIGSIMSSLYALRTRVVGQNSLALLGHLDQQLAKWYLKLPPHMHYKPDELQSPALLSLHAMFYTALILLHRPFVPARQRGDKPTGTAPTLPSLSIATTSANAITSIVTHYGRVYGFRHSTPFLVYPTFTAAIMHVYNVAHDPSLARVSRLGLSKCLKALKEMSTMWGSAWRQYELLEGMVDLAEAERELEAANAAENLRLLKRGHVTEPPTGTQTPVDGRPSMNEAAFRNQLDNLASLLPTRYDPLPGSFAPTMPAPTVGSHAVAPREATHSEAMNVDYVGGGFDTLLHDLLGSNAMAQGFNAPPVSAYQQREVDHERLGGPQAPDFWSSLAAVPQQSTSVPSNPWHLLPKFETNKSLSPESHRSG